MALKSYKVNQQPEESVLVKRKRSLKLVDLERRTKLRKKNKKGTKPKTSLTKTVLGSLRRFNQDLSRQSQRMPSGGDVSKWLWR